MKNRIGFAVIGLTLFIGVSAQAEESQADRRDARADLREEIASPIAGEYAAGNSFSYSNSSNYTKGEVGGYSGNGFIGGGGQIQGSPTAPGGSGTGTGAGTTPTY